MHPYRLLERIAATEERARAARREPGQPQGLPRCREPEEHALQRSLLAHLQRLCGECPAPLPEATGCGDEGCDEVIAMAIEGWLQDLVRRHEPRLRAPRASLGREPDGLPQLCFVLDGALIAPAGATVQLRGSIDCQGRVRLQATRACTESFHHGLCPPEARR